MSEHKSHKIRIEHIPQGKTRCSITTKKKSTDKKSFEGFDNFFVIFNDKNNEYADLIYISEIEGWEYRITNNGDKVMLYLTNNERYRIEENTDRKMYSYFRDIMPEREVRKKKEQ